jgi:two-component system invasion response regulator UvrY
MIRILIVDDHHVVSTAFQGLLGNQPGFIVVGTVGAAADALDWVRRDPPKIVLMDLRLPGMDGIEAARRIRVLNPTVHCIGLTAADEPLAVRSFFAAGGRGYLTKACRPSEVFTAIRRVAAGEKYLEYALSQRMTIDQLGGARDGSPFDLLSSRQLAVITIDLTGTEKNDALIGERLGISPKTVSTLRHRAYRKLGVASRGEVFQLARRWGLLGGLGDSGAAPACETSPDTEGAVTAEEEV